MGDSRVFWHGLCLASGMSSCAQKPLAKDVGLYRPRKPWKKDLYQAVSENWGFFCDHYDEHYLADQGPLSKRQKKTFEKFLECGILSYGFARARCSECRYEFLVAFSCQKKGLCPSCQAKRYELFSRFVLEEVIQELPHRQLVLTLPKILRRFFMPAKRRTRLCQIMQRVVHTFFVKALGFKKTQKPQSAMVCVLQTFGDELNFHPHLHVLCAEGLFVQRHFYPCPLEAKDFLILQDLFRAAILKYLVKEHCTSPEFAQKMMGWNHASGFSVNGQVYLPIGDKERMARLCRYIARPALSFERIQYNRNTGQVTLYKHKKDHQGNRKIACQIHVMELLLRLRNQIPPKGTHAQRYYGWYSSKARGQRKKKEQAKVQIQDAQRKKVQNKAWAIMIQQVFEVDPLSCPNCGGAMKLIAFLQRPQQEAIQAILDCRAIEIPDLQEMARGPPKWFAIQQAQEFVQAHPDAYPEENLDQSAPISEEAYFINPP